MTAAPALLAATTLALGAAAMMPRAGHPVLLVLPPGASTAAAFTTPGWRVLSLSSAGPLGLIAAVPDGPQEDPALLSRATGALLTLATTPGAACRPALPEK